MIKKLVCSGLFVVCSFFLSAQNATKIDSASVVEADTHDHESQEGEHGFRDHHQHHGSELGVAVSPAYFIKEKDLSVGIHVHYVYNIPHTKFGIGLGYERIIDIHQHNTFGIVASVRPIDKWSINVAPGLTFEKDEPNPLFAIHFETAYEWEYHNFHIGPAFEFAYDPEDMHISLGLHFGYGF